MFGHTSLVPTRVRPSPELLREGMLADRVIIVGYRPRFGIDRSGVCFGSDYMDKGGNVRANHELSLGRGEYSCEE